MAVMQSIKSSIVRRLRIDASWRNVTIREDYKAFCKHSRQLCTNTGTHSDQTLARVIGLVKQFDNIDAAKVTETADFQKDLSLDSLDRVELVMAFEQEFSMEIPEEEADKLKSCADVANFITSQSPNTPSI